jgi:hypothetical protein
MIPSPPALMTSSSSLNRSGKPSQGLWAWHLIKGLSILDSSYSIIFILRLKGYFTPGASNTKYFKFTHYEATGTFFFTAERVCENFPLPMNISPSKGELGQFFVKN